MDASTKTAIGVLGLAALGALAFGSDAGAAPRTSSGGGGSPPPPPPPPPPPTGTPGQADLAPGAQRTGNTGYAPDGTAIEYISPTGERRIAVRNASGQLVRDFDIPGWNTYWASFSGQGTTPPPQPPQSQAGRWDRAPGATFIRSANLPDGRVVTQYYAPDGSTRVTLYSGGGSEAQQLQDFSNAEFEAWYARTFPSTTTPPATGQADQAPGATPTNSATLPDGNIAYGYRTASGATRVAVRTAGGSLVRDFTTDEFNTWYQSQFHGGGGSTGGGSTGGGSTGGGSTGGGSTGGHTDEPRNRDTVEAFQRVLRAHGYRVAIDGVIGPETRQALENFQRDANRDRGWHLAIDGVLGPQTRSALRYYASIGGRDAIYTADRPEHERLSVYESAMQSITDNAAPPSTLHDLGDFGPSRAAPRRY